jgi:5-methylcytosine-specific restriction endonuclease McrA
MKLELLIIGVTVFFMANTYLDGKLVQYMKQWKKYYQIGLFAFVGLCVYLMLKKNPQQVHDLCRNANQYVKMMPIDRNTQNVLMPIIDFTKSSLDTVNRQNTNLRDQNNNQLNNYNNLTQNQKRVLTSGGNTNGKTKRSVSETKKKYVASEQGWRCKHCSIKLPAWFEVDHVVKLEYGGSNSIDNLEALCRDCHGKKTAMENL